MNEEKTSQKTESRLWTFGQKCHIVIRNVDDKAKLCRSTMEEMQLCPKVILLPRHHKLNQKFITNSSLLSIPNSVIFHQAFEDKLIAFFKQSKFVISSKRRI